MPSKSEKQHRFMEVAAHDASFAAKAHIPQHVAKEFVRADAGHSHSEALRRHHASHGTHYKGN